MKQPIIQPKTYVAAWVILMAGFGLTFWLGQMNLGIFNAVGDTLISMGQMLVVMIYFMHLRHSRRLTWLFAAAGFYWLGILLVLGLSDYFSRGWIR